MVKYKITGFADEIDSDIKVWVEVLKELGQRYTEIRSIHGKGIVTYTNEEAREMKMLLDSYGIKVSTVASAIGKIKITDDFEPHMEEFKHIVELAKIFETKYIRMFSFYLPEDCQPEAYETEVFRRIQALVDYAKENDVILLHENEKGIYGDSVKRCKKLMETFYGAHFQGVFDFANFIQCDEDANEAYQELLPYITYYHIKDAVKQTHEVVPPGLGDGKLKEIIKLVLESDYDGYFSMEPHLTEFAGLSSLELEHQEKSMTDGIKAYRLAYEYFQTLLKEIAI